MIRFIRSNIVMKEHPEHISLCFEITGCPHACEGCHSPELQIDHGITLSGPILDTIIRKYLGLIDCVIFMGGDHEVDELCKLLLLCKHHGLKTCLWTGSDYLDSRLQNWLDYVKLGRYIKNRGPLGSPNTNQKYLNLNTGEPIDV